jgi:hypothetical protein
MRLSMTSPLSSGRRDVRPGPDRWDRGLRTSPTPPRAHIGPVPHVPMRKRYSGMASTGLDLPGGPAPPRVGARPLWACLSNWPRGPDPLFLQDGVQRRHTLPRWQLQGRPCHVLVAEGPPRDASPTTALNAGRWAGCAQVKAWSAQLTPR